MANIDYDQETRDMEHRARLARIEAFEREHPDASGAYPSFFRALIWEASRANRTPSGEFASGYERAGYKLVSAARELVEGDVSDERIAAFDKAVDQRDAVAIVEWLKAALPRCMKLVPRRRLAMFERGIERAITAERV